MKKHKNTGVFAPYAEIYFLSVLRRIALHSSFLRMRNYLQHGDTDCLLHTIAVAYYCDRIARGIAIFRFRKRELLRGALLHDYFLYDWHIPGNGLHALRHPRIALDNALRDFALTDREQDIILRHMFPLTPRPPRYRESLLVSLVDKACSLYETIKRRHAYSKSKARSLYQYILRTASPAKG